MLTMRAFDNFYLQNYHQTDETNTCGKAILPSHAESLSTSLKRAFSTNTAEQRLALAAVLETSLLEKYKILLSPYESVGKKLNEVILLPIPMRVCKRDIAVRRSRPVRQYTLQAAPLGRKSPQL